VGISRDGYVGAGDEEICQTQDDVNNEANKLAPVEGDDTLHKITYHNVPAGEYSLAVYNFGQRNAYWGNEGPNDTCVFKVTDVCDVTITFDNSKKMVNVEGKFVELAKEKDVVETTAPTSPSESAPEATIPTVAALPEAPVDPGLGGGIWMYAFLALLVAVIVAAVCAISANKKKEKKRQEEERRRRAKEKRKAEEAAKADMERTELHEPTPAPTPAPAAAIPVKQPAVGIRSSVFQSLGARKDQQDSYGMTDPALYGQNGVMAIVADGMGGLANGKAVSSALVNTFVSGFRSVANYEKTQDQLMDLAITANQRINQMLAGAERSGSTLLSVVIRDGRLFFLTVGDSRIYLYRGGALLQLNREHIYQEELAVKAVNRQINLAQVTEDRQAHSLTSFFGIGNLPHMDRNFEGIRLLPGDRIMLCSDGVFGTLTQEQMEYALAAEDVRESARLMRDMIVEINKPYQDNNTGLILEYLG
jgi:serine/threonine protein phosphatase PrpC